ncbi:MAG: F-box-like [Chlamydiales bacterium]|jgi:hypothetical protein|nr:F-box-like [Chlamydiales bacterium]
MADPASSTTNSIANSTASYISSSDSSLSRAPVSFKPFEHLPEELILKIFSFLSDTDLCCTLPLICRSWQRIGNSTKIHSFFASMRALSLGILPAAPSKNYPQRLKIQKDALLSFISWKDYKRELPVPEASAIWLHPLGQVGRAAAKPPFSLSLPARSIPCKIMSDRCFALFKFEQSAKTLSKPSSYQAFKLLEEGLCPIESIAFSFAQMDFSESGSCRVIGKGLFFFSAQSPFIQVIRESGRISVSLPEGYLPAHRKKGRPIFAVFEDHLFVLACQRLGTEPPSYVICRFSLKEGALINRVDYAFNYLAPELGQPAPPLKFYAHEKGLVIQRLMGHECLSQQIELFDPHLQLQFRIEGRELANIHSFPLVEKIRRSGRYLAVAIRTLPMVDYASRCHLAIWDAEQKTFKAKYRLKHPMQFKMAGDLLAVLHEDSLQFFSLSQNLPLKSISLPSAISLKEKALFFKAHGDQMTLAVRTSLNALQVLSTTFNALSLSSKPLEKALLKTSCHGEDANDRQSLLENHFKP